MGIFSKERLGYKPLEGSPKEQIKVLEKNGYIYSKFLNYKFKIPDGAKISYYEYKDVWEIDAEHQEFSMTFGESCYIAVGIRPTLVEEKDKQYMENECDYSRLLRVVFEKSFGFKGDSVYDEVFLGRNYVHGYGVSTKLHKGKTLYVNEYLYGSPYCAITFFGSCAPEDRALLGSAMGGFSKIEPFSFISFKNVNKATDKSNDIPETNGTADGTKSIDKNSSGVMTLEEARAYCFSCHFTPSAMAQNTVQNSRYLRCTERKIYYPEWLGEYYDLVFEKMNTSEENIGLWFYNFSMVWGQMRGEERYKKHVDKLYMFLEKSINYSTDIKLSILRNFFGICPCYSGYWYLSLYEEELPRFKKIVTRLIQSFSVSGDSDKVEKYKNYTEVWDKYEIYNRLSIFGKERKRWEGYMI